MSLKQYLKRGARYVLHGVPTINVTADIHYTNPSEKLKGKHVIVTGGGRGLGYAMARKFVAEGA